MTTNSSVSEVRMYHCNTNFYTGNKTQPDVISVFVKLQPTHGKPDRIFKVCHLQAPSNWLDYCPFVSIFTGITKITHAVHVLFKELPQMKLKLQDEHRSESWNALKNLVRGFISIFPMVGNFSLILFDTFRYRVFTNNSLIKQLKDSPENIGGIAVDGEVVSTWALDEKTLNGKDPTVENYLKSIHNKVSSILQKLDINYSNLGIKSLFKNQGSL